MLKKTFRKNNFGKKILKKNVKKVIKSYGWIVIFWIPQTSFRIFLSQDQDQDSITKFINKNYALYTEDTHQISCRSVKFLWK